MSERDYNRQVVKRQRIGKATLVIGVDVGNACNAVGFMNRKVIRDTSHIITCLSSSVFQVTLREIFYQVSFPCFLQMFHCQRVSLSSLNILSYFFLLLEYLS